MKKILSIFLAVAMLASCGGKDQNVSDGKIQTITTEAKGQEDGLKVEVKFDGDKITEVNVLENNETPGVSDTAIENIPKAIVENNSINVDVVSGATNTSNGIIAAVKLAIEKAGLKVADFEKDVEKSKEGKEVEKETDVVVVGGGIAGLSAALEAVQNGAKVTLVEKMPVTGGSK